MRWIARKIFCDLLGWKLKGKIDPSVEKCVIIVAPHTSWYDFVVGAFARKLLTTEINFVAKKELFRPPFGWYFKWMGGTPLDRTPNQNKVDAIARIFREKKYFRLAIAPEGTRKKTLRWKTGYYYISKIAEVPIVMVAFNYAEKTVEFAEPFFPGQDSEADFKKIRDFYKDVQGKIPGYF